MTATDTTPTDAHIRAQQRSAVTRQRAMAYLRTSNMNGTGEDTDSAARQREAIRAYAEREGLQVVGEYYDDAVTGTDSVLDRPAFRDMVRDAVDLDAGLILVEKADRFARDLIVQITGHDMLKQAGLQLVPVDAPGYFAEDTPTAVMVRNILGAVSQYTKDDLVRRMYLAKERKRGLSPRSVPEVIRERVKELRARKVTWRECGEIIEAEFGKRYLTNSLRSMVLAWGGRQMEKRLLGRYAPRDMEALDEAAGVEAVQEGGA